MEGTVSTTNGTLSLQNIGVRNAAGNYDNTDLVGEIGPGSFIRLINELKQLKIKGGDKEGILEYERLTPTNSKLKDREKVSVPF